MNVLEYIGTISRAKGFRGDIQLKDVQKGIETIEKGSEIAIGYSESFSQKYTLKTFSTRGKNSGILRLEKINNESDVEPLIEKAAFTKRENINAKNKELPTLTEDIIGTKVFEKYQNSKSLLGTIVDIFYAPAHDIWVIEQENGEKDINFPATDNFIIEHNTEKKEVLVIMPDGLKDI